MTQVSALTTARRPSSGKKGWRLEFWNPLGQELLATYTQDNPGGIINGFVNKRYGNGTCGPLTFEGKPNEIYGAQARNIVRLEFDTGEERFWAHYGILISVPDSRSGAGGEFESVPTKILLENSPTNLTSHFLYTSPFDLVTALSVLTGRHRHKALRYDANRFTPSGIMLEGYNDFRDLNLSEVFRDALKAVPTIKDDDWGTDAEGYVVVRPPTGKIIRSFSEVIVNAQRGTTSGEDTCTEAKLRIAKDPSEGAVISAGYRPRVATYVYTDPANVVYEASRTFELPKRSDGKPIFEALSYMPREGLNWGTGWTASTGSSPINMYTVLTDGDMNTYAYSNQSQLNGLLLRFDNRITDFVGASVALDAPSGSYNLYLNVLFLEGSSIKHTVLFPLDNLIGAGKVEARFIAPHPADSTITEVQVNFSAGLGQSVPSGTTGLKVYEFRGLQINKSIAEGIAKANIRVPAQEVTEIICAKHVTSGGEPIEGFLLVEPAGTVEIPDVPAGDGKTVKQSGPLAEIVDRVTTDGGMYSTLALSEKIRAYDIRAVQDAIRRATERRF